MARETCELCEFEKLSECRSCDLSGDPNPESFTREELIKTLVLEARIKEAISERNGVVDANQISK